MLLPAPKTRKTQRHERQHRKGNQTRVHETSDLKYTSMMLLKSDLEN